MKIQILSDLHTEFWLSKDIEWLIPEDPPDVLVLAGDIGIKQNLEEVLRKFCKAYKQVIYIPGNHEYYNSSFNEIDDLISDLSDEFANLKANSSGVFEVGVLATTLWFPRFPNQKGNDQYKKSINDFHVIQDFDPAVYGVNKNNREFIEKFINDNCVVVTHHLPSHKSIPEEHKDSPLNRFFVCDMEDVILEKQPKLWIHGHTHFSCDYYIGQTRVVCNPFGYLGFQVNPNFNKHLVVEV
jgi:Icc-related predicted phosphoesterase